MEQTKSRRSAAIAAAVIFAVLAVRYFFSFVGSFSYYRWAVAEGVSGAVLAAAVSVIRAAACAVLCIGLFKRSRGMLLVVGTAMLALVSLLLIVQQTLISGVCYLLAYAGVLFVTLAYCAGGMEKLRSSAKKLWYVPAILLGIVLITDVLYMLKAYTVSFGYAFGTVQVLISVFWALLNIAGLMLFMYWLTGPEESEEEKSREYSAPESAGAYGGGEYPGYCGLLKHILLLFFTFGVWMLIWIYRTTEYLNRVKDEEYRDPTSKLLLCIFVPFYSIYWTYKSAQRIDKLARETGVESDISTLCLILSFIVNVVPPILMQDKINSIAIASANGGANARSSRESGYTGGQGEYHPHTAGEEREDDAAGAENIAKALSTYKQLLDSGVITEEEYNAKKKQLLGL